MKQTDSKKNIEQEFLNRTERIVKFRHAILDVKFTTNKTLVKLCNEKDENLVAVR